MILNTYETKYIICIYYIDRIFVPVFYTRCQILVWLMVFFLMINLSTTKDQCVQVTTTDHLTILTCCICVLSCCHMQMKQYFYSIIIWLQYQESSNILRNKYFNVSGSHSCSVNHNFINNSPSSLCLSYCTILSTYCETKMCIHLKERCIKIITTSFDRILYRNMVLRSTNTYLNWY